MHKGVIPATQVHIVAEDDAHSRTLAEIEALVQAAELPDLCESGTPNVVGLAGLVAGLAWVVGQGVEAIRAHELSLTQRLIDGLLAIPRVTVYGSRVAGRQTATVSFRLANLEPGEAGLRLNEEYGIMCRVGLHCSPAAHRTIDTFPVGTVRFGLAARNTEAMGCPNSCSLLKAAAITSLACSAVYVIGCPERGLSCKPSTLSGLPPEIHRRFWDIPPRGFDSACILCIIIFSEIGAVLSSLRGNVGEAWGNLTSSPAAASGPNPITGVSSGRG